MEIRTMNQFVNFTSPRKIHTTVCRYCGKKYNTYNIYNGYCSWTCKSKHNKELSVQGNK